MVRVIAYGTFDIIHPGHHHFLRQAKALGDELLVIVGRDEIVKKVKGRSPDHPASARIRQVLAIPSVDKVEIGHKTDMYAHLVSYRPDVIALGYDQEAFTEDLPAEMIRRKVMAKIVRLPPLNESVWKSSILRGRKQGKEDDCKNTL